MERTAYTNALGKKLLRWIRRRDWTGWRSGLAGFGLSAAGLWGQAMPVALGLLCAAPPGRQAFAIALGGSLGYLLFWQDAQGVAWMVLGLLAVLLAGDTAVARQQKLLLPATAALVVSSSGVGFLLWMLDDVAVSVYLLRVLLGAVSTAVYRLWRQDPTGPAGWLARGLGTLALARIQPFRWLNLGALAAAFFGLRGSLPAAAFSGLGLDLAEAAPVTMTGVLCFSFLLRLVPGIGRVRWLGPGVVYLGVCTLCGKGHMGLLPALLLGGALGEFLPGNTLNGSVLRRKGPTGIAQVRLELAANSLKILRTGFSEELEPEPDRRAVLQQALDNACDTCPERRSCKTRTGLALLPTQLLERPGLLPGDLPPGCKKTNRLLGELRRSQEQLRRIKGDRAARWAYRAALLDMLSFLEEYIRDLGDGLCTLQGAAAAKFRLDLGICGRGRNGCSGDCCVSFPGVGNKTYVLLCDGMGTGPEARRAGQETVALLKSCLQAGFVSEQALRSYNDLRSLTGTGGWSTVDLLEADLGSGEAALYKWGAWPSYLLRGGQLKKVGTAGAPPGLSRQERETVERLSLSGGETLILLSDGAGEEGLLRREWTAAGIGTEEMAAQILELGAQRFDDATVAVVRLSPLGLDTP